MYNNEAVDLYAEERILRRKRARAAMLRKRKRRRRIIIICSLSLLIILMIILIIKSIQQKNTKSLAGSWRYDEFTVYEFDSDGNGCMYLEELSYDCTYTVKKDTLSLDFKDESVHDCTYTFSINSNTLTLVGGEGTVGGSYTLKRQN